MKTTPLHEWHIASGANMAEFASYDMPLWYPHGAKQEHLAVIRHAGLFDTSHMAAILIHGPGARDLLQKCFTKDLDSCLGKSKTELVSGACTYGVFLSEYGHVMDDAIVYQVNSEKYLVVVNASMGATIADHLLRSQESFDISVEDLTDQLGKIDIQGPASGRILFKILQKGGSILQKMGYFTFSGWFTDGATDSVILENNIPILLSRTGYTGEYGFEIFTRAEVIESVWQMLVDAGKKEGLITCGLAARDSLRTGAFLPLSHQDIGNWPFCNTPWQFALPIDKHGCFTKDFIGKEALARVTGHGFTYGYAGFSPRKIGPSGEGHVADIHGEKIGRILTCTTDMAIDRVGDEIISIASPLSAGRPEDFRARGLSCGFILVDRALNQGDIVHLVAGKREVKVEIRKDIRPDRTARQSFTSLSS